MHPTQVLAWHAAVLSACLALVELPHLVMSLLTSENRHCYLHTLLLLLLHMPSMHVLLPHVLLAAPVMSCQVC